MSVGRYRALTVVFLVPLVFAGPSAADGRSSQAWPQRLVASESNKVAAHTVSGQALYQLVSKTLKPIIHGPYLLERRDLVTGVVQKGPTFPVGNIVIASGYVWISGASAVRPRLFQVDPNSLNIIRSITLPKAPTPYPWVDVAAGPDRSVWLGTSTMLRRIDVATGQLIKSVAAPPRLAVAGLAVDPSGAHLYVAMAHVVKGGLDGGMVMEYDAHSGNTIADADRGLVTYATAGAGLTAVPGGVWASFRTGMLGLTIHLRQRDLAEVAPPGKKVAQAPADSLFHWPMGASTIYVGGSLWIANEAGFIACLDPQTAKVRARERVPPAQAVTFIGADVSSRQLFITADSGRGVVEITPPRQCWS